MPVVGFISARALASDVHLVAAFRQELAETGYVEGQNVAIEYAGRKAAPIRRLHSQPSWYANGFRSFSWVAETVR